MSTLDIIRAWKDAEYRLSLSAEQQALLPAHPAGLIALTDAELDAAVGGDQPDTAHICSICHCPSINDGCDGGSG